jgi:hypothetical protein
MMSTTEEHEHAERYPECLIYWYERPEAFPFVRCSEDYVSSRTQYPVKQMIGHNYRVVGHAMIKDLVDARYTGRWLMRIFTVRDYDTTPEYGGFIPSEAVDPLTLAPNERGIKTDRCKVGRFPKHPYRSQSYLISRAAKVGDQYQRQMIEALQVQHV